MFSYFATHLNMYTHKQKAIQWDTIETKEVNVANNTGNIKGKTVLTN